MKTLFPVLLLYLLSLAACTKSARDLAEDNGCIERIIIPVTAHSINSSDVQEVNNLFSSNGIDNSKLRYYRYDRDTLQTQYPPYTKYAEQVVRVDQYTNNLRIFTGDMVYLFLDKHLSYKGGELTKGTSLDATPQLTTGQIRKLFIDDIEQYDHAAAKYKDSCFKAEFGYFNLNAGTGNTQEVLVKAWRVTLKNSVYPSEYPVAYYRDEAGALIYYDNGIRTFK